MIPQIVGTAVTASLGLLERAVHATPGISRVHHWTKHKVSTSKSARHLLKMVVYGALIGIAVTLYKTFDFISCDKVDLVTGSLLAGIFTVFSGILAIALPAFVNVVESGSTTPENQPPSPPVA